MSVRRAQLMLARVLCVLLILTSAWLVLLGALQTTGVHHQMITEPTKRIPP